MQRFIVGFTICVMLAFPAIAQNVSGSTDDTLAEERLETLIQEALENNPQIKSAEQQRVAMSQRVAQVSSLDDPMFTYTHWFSSIETRVGPLQNAFMLSQRLPFFGKLRFRGDMAEQDIEVAEQAYKAQEIWC